MCILENLVIVRCFIYEIGVQNVLMKKAKYENSLIVWCIARLHCDVGGVALSTFLIQYCTTITTTIAAIDLFRSAFFVK